MKTKSNAQRSLDMAYDKAIKFIREESGSPEEVKKFYGKWERNLAKSYISHLNANPKEDRSFRNMEIYFKSFTELSIKEMLEIQRYKDVAKRYKKVLPGKIEKTKERIIEWQNKLIEINKKCNDPTTKGFEKLKNKTKKKNAKKQKEFYMLKAKNLMKKFLNIQ